MQDYLQGMQPVTRDDIGRVARDIELSFEGGPHAAHRQAGGKWAVLADEEHNRP